MKYLMILCLLPLSALARVDGNDGPHGAPQPPMPTPPRASVLAEMTLACGFMCPNGDVHGLRIALDGTVVSYSYSRNTPEQDVVVAQISAGTMQKLRADAAKVVGGELQDQQQGQPECMDAPTTTYQVRGKRGEMIKVAQNYGCHDHVLADGQGALLVDVLKGLNTLPR